MTKVFAMASPSDADPAELLIRLGPAHLAERINKAPVAADVIVDRHIASSPDNKYGAEAELCLLREILTDVRRMDPRDVARQVTRVSRRLSFDSVTVTRELADAPPPGVLGHVGDLYGGAADNAIGMTRGVHSRQLINGCEWGR
jgi:hypothetical protein